MGAFYKGIPPYLTPVVRDGLGIKFALETGTYRGDSAQLLADEIGRCVTIELHSGLADDAVSRFATDPRIEVRQGSSRFVMPQILETLDEPALFWLDGHWSGQGTAGSEDMCPVDGELASLANWPHIASSVVAIDDARMFGFASVDDPHKEQYPSLLSIGKRFEEFGLELFLVDDVIIGFPPEDRELLLKVRSSGLIAQDRLSADARPLRKFMSLLLGK